MTQLEASLQHDMDLIRSTVQEMSAQCERALRGALTARVDGGRQSAYLVVLRDQQIDELEQQLDRLCLEYLVRQQPAAGHLRFAYAAIKISTALERIGDHAEAMARRILRLGPTRPALSLGPLVEMGEISVGMLLDAIRAFITSDADLARGTMPVERMVDDRLRAVEAMLTESERAGQLTAEAAGLLAAFARRIERVSDEVRDICADTLYMCTGDYVKHTSPEAFRILFVDQHNHCRSQMAEAISATIAHTRLLFSSAGLDPRPIDPRLSAFLREKGLEIVGHRPKSIDQIPNLEHYYVVVSFDENAYYALRFRRTPTVCIDWPVDDPSLLPGTLHETRAAYEAAFSLISEQLKDLVEAVVRQEKA